MHLLLSPSQLNRIFLFGDFEFSVRAGELRKNGEVVRLQQQPLRVLLALLEYSGEAITREELRDQVWPNDSVQDVDNSLRVAVNKLRQALGDDPDNPQYIETLPRRGYRWLYPVTVHENVPNNLEHEAAPVGGNGANPSSPGVAMEVPVSPKRTHRRVDRKSAVFTLILVLAAFGASRLWRPAQDLPSPRVLPLTSYPGLQSMPSLSPDGQRVAFAWTGPNAADPYAVYLKHVGDDRVQRLTDAPADAGDGDPVWTPDGKAVFFFRRGGPSPGIYMAPAQGGPARQVTSTGISGRQIRRSRFDISPDGSTIVYPDRVADTRTIALFLLDLKTTQSHQLTYPPPDSEGDGDPAFSHDGKRVAFQRDILDLQRVHVVPAAGGEARVLTENNRTDIDGLAWTVDDREILVGGQQLRRISSSKEDRAPSVVSYMPGPVGFPSLRSELLAYSTGWVNANIWKLDLQSPAKAAGVPTKLITSTHQQGAASFSPDSSQIAFQSDRSGAWEIWKCKRDGSNAVQLTHFRGPLTGTPRWSPDGKQIVFDSRGTGTAQIYLIPSDGGEPRQLTNDSASSIVPSWSRDGKWIYYTSYRGGARSIWKVPASGGKEQPVTTQEGIYAVESPDGRYVYYSRSNSDTTLWRIPANGGPEERVPEAPKPFGVSHWTMGASGIYIIDANGDLLLYSLANQSVTKIIHRPEMTSDWSTAISPDGREIVWAQIDDRFVDLMLVENFH